MNRHCLIFLAFTIISVLATGCASKIGSLSNEFSDDGWDSDELADDELYGNSTDETGVFKDCSDGLMERKIIYRDLSAAKASVDATEKVSGKIVTRLHINRLGDVTYVELAEGTTLENKEVLKLYLKAARGYKFLPDPDAPEIQCGTLTFTVNNDL